MKGQKYQRQPSLSEESALTLAPADTIIVQNRLKRKWVKKILTVHGFRVQRTLLCGGVVHLSAERMIYWTGCVREIALCVKYRTFRV
jgi:hypothetical protein